MTELPGSPSLASYLEAVASGEPAPGGGSVVAIVGALAAALGEMVCRLTIGRPAYAAADPELAPVLASLTAMRDRLVALAADDERAYRRYIEASVLPKSTERERNERRLAMQQALVGAMDVPLAVAAGCRRVGEQLAPVARLGNRHALSDAAAAALLVDAARRGALHNVSTNAALLTDREAAAEYLARAGEIDAAGQAATESVLSLVREREHR